MEEGKQEKGATGAARLLTTTFDAKALPNKMLKAGLLASPLADGRLLGLSHVQWPPVRRRCQTCVV